MKTFSYIRRNYLPRNLFNTTRVITTLVTILSILMSPLMTVKSVSFTSQDPVDVMSFVIFNYR